MTGYGTKLPNRDICKAVAFEGKADVARTTVLTQLRHWPQPVFIPYII
jgi:hypothetical protein